MSEFFRKLLPKAFSSNEAPASLRMKAETSLDLLNLHEQYQQWVSMLIRAEIISVLPEKRELGIIGADGQEYPLPKEVEIAAALRLKPELYAQKIAEGFDQLVLVPIGLPLLVLSERLSDLFGHHLGAQLKPRRVLNGQGELVFVSLNMSAFFKHTSEYFSEVLQYPSSFEVGGNTTNPTKAELLQQGLAWQVGLASSTSRLLSFMKNQHKAVLTFPHHTNQTILTDVRSFLKNPIFTEEVGLSLEAWMVMSIHALIQDNALLYNYSEIHSTFLMGSEKQSGINKDKMMPASILLQKKWDGAHELLFNWGSLTNDLENVLSLPTLVPIPLK